MTGGQASASQPGRAHRVTVRPAVPAAIAAQGTLRPGSWPTALGWEPDAWGLPIARVDPRRRIGHDARLATNGLCD